MAFGINVYNIRSIRSYEDAAAYFNETAPLRGMDKEQMGVSLRGSTTSSRKYTMLKKLVIFKGRDEAGNTITEVAYACALYGTNVVTFHADHSVVVNIAYGSRSTDAFANRHLGWWPSPLVTAGERDKHHAITTQAGKVYFQARDAAGIRFEAVASGGDCGECFNIDISTVRRMNYKKLNLKRAAAARKSIAPFVAYVKTMMALGDVSSDAVREMREGSTPPLWRTPSMEHMTNPEKFARVLSAYYIDAGWRTPGVARLHVNTAEMIRDHVYRVQQVYDEVELPLGQTRRGMY